MGTVIVGGTSYTDLRYTKDLLYPSSAPVHDISNTPASVGQSYRPVNSGKNFLKYEYLLVEYATAVTVSSVTTYHYAYAIINTCNVANNKEYHLAMVVDGITYSRRIYNITASYVYFYNGYKGNHHSTSTSGVSTACIPTAIWGISSSGTLSAPVYTMWTGDWSNWDTHFLIRNPNQVECTLRIMGYIETSSYGQDQVDVTVTLNPNFGSYEYYFDYDEQPLSIDLTFYLSTSIGGFASASTDYVY